MIRKASRCVCAFFLLLCGGAVRANAADLTLTGDTHVSSARATTNFGTLSNLYVGSGNTALLQFDTASLPANLTGTQIAKATLTVYVNRIITPGAMSVSPVTSAWTESAVTFGTLPTLGNAVASVTPAQSGQFVTVDVTSLVQGWLSGSTNYGIALTSATGSLLLDSKENDQTGHAARLDVTVTSAGAVGAVGPQGPIGPTGPQGAAGATGPAGPQGLTGTAGTPGAAGPVGPTGLTGAAGPVGAVGPIGPQGATGPQGVAGATGAIGPQGTAGPTGLTGAAGPQGLPGTTGAAGPQGAAGATGAQGPIGPAGPAGAQGTAGGQLWAAAITFPSEYGDGVYYAPPTGASTLQSPFQGNALPVPQTCSASTFNVMLVGALGGSSVTLSLRSYNQRDGNVPTGISCTVTAGSTGTGSCTYSTATPLFYANIISLQASSIRVSRLANDPVTATVSFVCR